MPNRSRSAAITVALLTGLAWHTHPPLHAGSLVGYVRDHNWYARYRSFPLGVGYYEFAVNANATNISATGGLDDTDVYGYFQMNNMVAGSYTVVSWDVWWRSAYAFNVQVPSSGNSRPVDLRLNATMWGYPAFWDDAGYYEFGQTFVATGPISMIYLRCPYSTSYRLTVHEDGPGGRQVGQARTFSGGDQRPIYGYGDMPTIAGRTYYARVRTTTSGVNGVIMQMEPRPDFSDPMPGGCLWLGTTSQLKAYPDRDLGMVIMSDDDGLITDLYTRASGSAVAATTRLGQTFVARGVGLISAAFWLADPSAPVYSVAVYEDAPGGGRVGTTKQGKPARLGADPEMIVAWAPGECPLLPGQTYYIEVTKSGGGTFYSAYVNRGNPFPYGQAYSDGTPLANADLAGTLMEEERPGSAAMPVVNLVTDLAIPEADRGIDTLAVRWGTDVPSDSVVDFAANAPPYTASVSDSNLTTSHLITLQGLRPHTLYHIRVRSSADAFKPLASRDFVVCTRPRTTNFLVNPGFETGTGASPRKTIPGWMKTATSVLDVGMSDGTWFGELKPHSGTWLLQGALNGGSSDGVLYQRVRVTPARKYAFSAWVMTRPLEKINSVVEVKYDVWNSRNRLIYMRLGLDPTGGTNPQASTVQWTPRTYSHLRYSNPAITVQAQGNYVTAFVSMKGDGVEWHLYGLDDCVLTEVEASPPRLSDPRVRIDGSFSFLIQGDPGTTNLVQASTNLVDWRTLTQMVVTNTVPPEALDAQAGSLPHGFYRVMIPAP